MLKCKEVQYIKSCDEITTVGCTDINILVIIHMLQSKMLIKRNKALLFS